MFAASMVGIVGGALFAHAVARVDFKGLTIPGLGTVGEGSLGFAMVFLGIVIVVTMFRWKPSIPSGGDGPIHPLR